MRLGEFSSPKQYSRNSIPPVSLCCVREGGCQIRGARTRRDRPHSPGRELLVPTWKEAIPRYPGSVASMRVSKLFLRVGFLAERISRGFLLLSRRIFCRRILFPSCLWEKCTEKSSRKILGKILQNLYNKDPRQVSAEGPGQSSLPRENR